MKTKCSCGKKHKANEAFYVSVVDGGRVALLAGPFRKHEDAIARVEEVRVIGEKLDRRAVFYAFGTVGKEMPPDTMPGLTSGSLNDKLGLSTTTRWAG